ncbi:MAG: hypothetical protein WEB59_01965 [Thermoanaerobaculia bacterium]
MLGPFWRHMPRSKDYPLSAKRYDSMLDLLEAGGYNEIERESLEPFAAEFCRLVQIARQQGDERADAARTKLARIPVVARPPARPKRSIGRPRKVRPDVVFLPEVLQLCVRLVRRAKKEAARARRSELDYLAGLLSRKRSPLMPPHLKSKADWLPEAPGIWKLAHEVFESASGEGEQAVNRYLGLVSSRSKQPSRPQPRRIAEAKARKRLKRL